MHGVHSRQGLGSGETVSVERGLMLGGLVVPGTDWIIRDSAAWWNPTDYGAKPRAKDTEINVLTGHWTAGEAGARRADDDGPFIVRVMRNRPSKAFPPPAKMKVSIHFVIGADGTVWQTMDPLTTVAIHVGDGRINARSIGVEVVNPGTGPMVPQRPRKTVKHRMFPTLKQPQGRVVAQRAFYPTQINAWVDLAETLALHVSIPRQVPRGAQGGLELERFTDAEAKRWKGAMEHFHVPSTEKRDAGTQLIRALMDGGWPTVTP